MDTTDTRDTADSITSLKLRKGTKARLDDLREKGEVWDTYLLRLLDLARPPKVSLRIPSEASRDTTDTTDTSRPSESIPADTRDTSDTLARKCYLCGNAEPEELDTVTDLHIKTLGLPPETLICRDRGACRARQKRKK